MMSIPTGRVLPGAVPTPFPVGCSRRLRDRQTSLRCEPSSHSHVPGSLESSLPATPWDVGWTLLCEDAHPPFSRILLRRDEIQQGLALSPVFSFGLESVFFGFERWFLVSCRCAGGKRDRECGTGAPGAGRAAGRCLLCVLASCSCPRASPSRIPTAFQAGIGLAPAPSLLPVFSSPVSRVWTGGAGRGCVPRHKAAPPWRSSPEAPGKRSLWRPPSKPSRVLG